MNHITLCGYLGKDFEVIRAKSDTNTDIVVAKNSLAITKRRKITKNNETTITEYTNWIPIVLFGKIAETASEYLTKGDRFLGSGYVHTGAYTDKNGDTRYSWQVVIRQFEFVNSRKGEAQDEAQACSTQKEMPKELNNTNENMKEIQELAETESEEIPF